MCQRSEMRKKSSVIGHNLSKIMIQRLIPDCLMYLTNPSNRFPTAYFRGSLRKHEVEMCPALVLKSLKTITQPSFSEIVVCYDLSPARQSSTRPHSPSCWQSVKTQTVTAPIPLKTIALFSIFSVDPLTQMIDGPVGKSVLTSHSSYRYIDQSDIPIWYINRSITPAGYSIPIASLYLYIPLLIWPAVFKTCLVYFRLGLSCVHPIFNEIYR